MCACAQIVFSKPHLIFETLTVRRLLFVRRRQEANCMKRAPKQRPSFSLNNDESKSRKSGQQQITRESDFRFCHFDLPVNYRICTMSSWCIWRIYNPHPLISALGSALGRYLWVRVAYLPYTPRSHGIYITYNNYIISESVLAYIVYCF